MSAAPLTLAFRDATRDDVPAIVAMLRDDALGAARETAGMEDYLAAFDGVAADPTTTIVVAEAAEAPGRLLATFQITVLSGLSLRAARRAQIESVRVAAGHRSHGIGAEVMAEAERRARAAGCSLMQLTTHASRIRAHAFYERLGFTPSHIGYKRTLD